VIEKVWLLTRNDKIPIFGFAVIAALAAGGTIELW